MNVLMPYLIVICVSCVGHGHRGHSRDASTPSTRLEVQTLRQTMGNHIMNMFRNGKMSMAVTSTL